jgi:predicted Zn-dependent peptidase
MLIIEKDNLDRVVLNFVFENCGQLYSKDGVANFTAQILNSRGSIKNPNSNFSEILDDNAIHFSASAGRETFTINLTFLKEKQELTYEMIKELLTSPNFSNDSFEKTKKEIIAKITTKENDYDYVASKLLSEISFENEMSRAILGEDIESISLQDIKEFFNSLSKEKLSIMAGGNIDKKELNIDEITSILPSSPKVENKYFTPKISFKEINKNVEQSYIYFLSPFNITKEERYKAKIATHILGSGGFGSRLMEEIRVKRGFAYSAYARNSFSKTKNTLSGYMQTKIENQEEAIKTLKEEISKFVKKGITKEELTSAKQFLIGSEPLRNETMSQRLNRKFNEYYEELGEDYFTKELHLIKEMSIEEINEFIKSHTEIENLSIAIVTNR